MRYLIALLMSFTAVACSNLTTGPTDLPTTRASAATSALSSTSTPSPEPTFAISFVSQTGPHCGLPLDRVPTADPVPIPHDGEEFISFTFCVTGEIADVTASLIDQAHPGVRYDEHIGTYGPGCHDRTVYAPMPSFPGRYDLARLDATDGALHASDRCSVTR